MTQPVPTPLSLLSTGAVQGSPSPLEGQVCTVQIVGRDTPVLVDAGQSFL